MKKNKIILASLVIGLLTISLISCNKSGDSYKSLNGTISDLVDEDEKLIPNETLTNEDFYTNNFNDEQIENQWSEYGIGDPFLYRWNGTYYLYVSTKDGNQGVRGYKSTDLVHYEPMTGEGLPYGYVSNDESTLTAYAPEVMYKNGTFYMILSPAGNGHIMLKSDSPEGPFVKCSNELDTNIDGSFFYGNDENVYLLKADSGSIVGNLLNDSMNGFLENVRFNNTSIGNWTEGPYLLERDGIYYLTYTGTNVASSAYRVGYSYSENEDFFNSEAFTQEDTILLNTSNEYQGLGHSSTVLGPNMDSYYIAYHNLRSSGGPIRGYNIAKLNFDGTLMNVDHPELTNNINPELATFNSYNGENLNKVDGFLLTNEDTGDAFTVEYNVIGTGAKMIFSYKDSANYSYASFDNNIIKVNKVNNGVESEIYSKTLQKSYDFSKLHTLRLSYKDNQFDITFDNIRIVNDFEAKFDAGKIGYNDLASFTIGYTGFSNYAEGSCENNHIYQDRINANSYSEELSKLNDSELVKVTPNLDIDTYYDNAIIGSYYMDLENTLDRATYKMYFDSDSIKGVSIRVPHSSLGKKIGIRVNDGDIIEYTIPNYSSSEYSDFYLELGNIKVNKGVNYISLYNVGDEVSYLYLDFYNTSNILTTYSNDLTDFVKTGATYVNTWKIRNGGHYALSGTRQLVYFGDETLGDVDVSVTLNFDNDFSTATAGVVISGKNASFSIWDDYNSIQGYYCYVSPNDGSAAIDDYNYNLSQYGEVGWSDDGSIDVAKDINIRVVKDGKQLTMYVNGTIMCSYLSPLGNTRGYVGLYTSGAGVTYKNLTIKTL